MRRAARTAAHDPLDAVGALRQAVLAGCQLCDALEVLAAGSPLRAEEHRERAAGIVADLADEIVAMELKLGRQVSLGDLSWRFARHRGKAIERFGVGR